MFAWANVPSTKVLWPVEVVEDFCYCKSDDAWFPLKAGKGVKQFTGQKTEIEKQKDAAKRLLQRKPKTLLAFLSDLDWVLSRYNCDASATPSGDTGLTSGADVTDDGGNSTIPDGDPSVTGDGDNSTTPDGDPSVTGDGDNSTIPDGDPSVTGDGDNSTTPDGDPSVTGDGDNSTTPDGDPSVTGDRDNSTTPEGDDSKLADGDTNVTADGDHSTTPNGDTNTMDDEDTNMTGNGDASMILDGDTNAKVDGDNSTIPDVDANLTAIGDDSLTPDGEANMMADGDTNVTVEGDNSTATNGDTNDMDTSMILDGNTNIKVDGNNGTAPDVDVNLTADRDDNLSFNGDANMMADEDKNMTGNGDASMIFDGDTNAKVEGDNSTAPDVDVNVTADGEDSLTPDGDANMMADGDNNVTVKGNNSTTPNGNTNTMDDGDNNVTVEGDNSTTPNGDTKAMDDRDNNLTVEGDNSTTPDGDANMMADGDNNVTVEGDDSTTPNGDTNAIDDRDNNLTVKGDSTTPNGDTNVMDDRDNNVTVEGDNSTTPNGDTNAMDDRDNNVTVKGNNSTTPNGDTNIKVDGDNVTTPDGDDNLTPDGDSIAMLNGDTIMTPNRDDSTTPNGEDSTTPDRDTNATVEGDNSTTPDGDSNMMDDEDTNVTGDGDASMTSDGDANRTTDGDNSGTGTELLPTNDSHFSHQNKRKQTNIPIARNLVDLNTDFQKQRKKIKVKQKTVILSDTEEDDKDPELSRKIIKALHEKYRMVDNSDFLNRKKTEIQVKTVINSFDMEEERKKVIQNLDKNAVRLSCTEDESDSPVQKKIKAIFVIGEDQVTASSIPNQKKKVLAKQKSMVISSDEDNDDSVKINTSYIRTDDVVPASDNTDCEILSDTFPELNKVEVKKDAKSELPTDSDEDETAIETPIARDCNHKNIFVKLVQKSRQTKNGKRKKSDRVYNTTHPCLFCQKEVANFSKHLMTMAHKHEPLVKEILETTDAKARKAKIQALRLKGIHLHNMKVLEAKKGEIMLRRRYNTGECSSSEDSSSDDSDGDCKGKAIDVSKYGPCPQCFGWILVSSIKRHMKTCTESSGSYLASASSGTLAVQSDIIAGRIPEKASPVLVKEVFPIMLQDKVCQVAKNDDLILNLGNQWMLRNMGNTIMRKYYTSTVMRLVAKLKLALQELDKSQGNLESYFCPKHFETVIKAALRCSLMEDTDEEDLKSPSNAIKLGHDIKRMVSAKLANALITGNTEKRQESEQFLQLMQIDWGLKVTKLARTILNERSFNQEKPLPLPDDVKKLANYMQQELEHIDLNDFSWNNYRCAAMLSLARITLYNRRRCHEVQAMKISTYEMRKQGVNDLALTLRGDLTPFESNLLNRQEFVVVRGKTGKGVPVIIPEDAKDVLQFLINPNTRKEAGVPPGNQYVFGSNGAGVFRAYDAIRRVSADADLEFPNLIKTSNMRKYMATMLQALNTTDAERQWVLDHMGHTMNVHKIHYRQTSDILERVDVAKILIIQDMGLVGKYKGKRLDDIQLQDLMTETPNQTPAEDAPLSATGSNDVSDILQADGGELEEYVPDIHYETDEEDVEEDKRRRKPRKSTSRQKWTLEEVEELQTLFKKDLKNDKCPNQKRVEALMKESKQNGGIIHNRQRDTIKKKVSNMLVKQRQQKMLAD